MTEDDREVSSIVVFRGPIEESVDVTGPELSVTERYYTPYYKVGGKSYISTKYFVLTPYPFYFDSFFIIITDLRILSPTFTLI